MPALRATSAQSLGPIGVFHYSPAGQTRRTQPRDPVNTRYVAQLLESAGVDRVVTLDDRRHSDPCSGGLPACGRSGRLRSRHSRAPPFGDRQSSCGQQYRGPHSHRQCWNRFCSFAAERRREAHGTFDRAAIRPGRAPHGDGETARSTARSLARGVRRLIQHRATGTPAPLLGSGRPTFVLGLRATQLRQRPELRRQSG